MYEYVDLYMSVHECMHVYIYICMYVSAPTRRRGAASSAVACVNLCAVAAVN